MKVRTLGAAIAIAAIGVASIGAGDADARHGRRAAIVGGAILGLAVGAALARPRYYYDDYAYYDGYYDGPPRGYYRAPPLRRYYRAPPRRYHAPRSYYYEHGPYDYPDSYAKAKIKRRHFAD